MNKKEQSKVRRHYRIRKKVTGTPERPRVSVYRSVKHIYVQFIDDLNGKTLASASSMLKELKGQKAKKTEMAGKVGELAGAAAKKAGIVKVVFDRGGNQYHGRVKAVAESLRKAGLEF